MKKTFKIYLKIVLIFTVQFAFSSCDLLENLFNVNQNSENSIRADYTLTASDDAFVRQNAANQNFGNVKTIKLISTNGANKQGFIKFLVPNITDKITKAVLKIYVINGTNDGPRIYRTTKFWSENSVTWNNKPSVSGSIYSNPGSLSKGWKTIDVTKAVYKNTTLTLVLIPDSSDAFGFRSRESQKKPQLVIQTDSAGGTNTGGNTGKTCKNHCGGQNQSAGCYCDSACVKYKDCCPDFMNVCDSGDNTGGNTGGNTGNEHFTTSSGTTDLNYADVVAFANGYKKLGHTHDKYTQKVTKSQLKSILTAKKIFNYHGGHGNAGLIQCTDGNLYANDFKSSVQVQYSIFATCVTLKSTDWYNAFGSNAKMIMGFTKNTYDDSALTMAKEFTKHLSNGETYLQAWYKTNSVIPKHQDRWAVFAREGSKIVLYSAQSGNTPKYSPRGTPSILSDDVTIDNILLDEWNSTTKFDRSFQVAVVDEMTIPLGRSLPQDTWPKNRSYITVEQAKTKATNALGNNLPAKAQMDVVIPIEKCDISDVCFTVGYQVYFTQQYDGLNLCSNSMADYVSVLVYDNGVASINFTWSQVTPLDDTIIDRSALLNASEALKAAAEGISNIIRKPVNIVTYDKVYGISTDVDNDDRTLVPAYEFIGSNGERFVVSAVTGELIY